MDDLNDRLKHFQSINASNVTNTVNILMTITVGVAAFAVNIIVNAKGPLGASAARYLLCSLILLVFAALTGIAILFMRIEDYRRTIRGVVMMMRDTERKNPSEVTEQQVRQAVSLKRMGDRLNKTTNILLYVQPILFILGFISLTISVLITNCAKLK